MEVGGHGRELLELRVGSAYLGCSLRADSDLYCSRAVCMSDPTALQSDLIAMQFAMVGLADLLNSLSESDQSMMLPKPARKEGLAKRKSDII